MALYKKPYYTLKAFTLFVPPHHQHRSIFYLFLLILNHPFVDKSRKSYLKSAECTEGSIFFFWRRFEVATLQFEVTPPPPTQLPSHPYGTAFQQA